MRGPPDLMGLMRRTWRRLRRVRLSLGNVAWAVLACVWIALGIGYVALAIYQQHVFAKVDRVIHEARMEMRL